jgi:hypothetical protein
LPYVVNTAADRFSRGQVHCGSDPVPSAAGPPEGSDREPQACSSRVRLRTRRRRGVGRLHSRSVRPRATLDQLCLGWADRGSSTRTPHGGPGPKQRCEVLGGDDLVMVDLMVVDKTLGPDASRVLPVAGGLLVRRRRLAPDPQVAVRPGLPSRPAASGVSPPGHRRSHRPTSQMDHRRSERANGPSSWRCPTAYTCSRSLTSSTPIEASGRNHRGQVVSAAPWRFLRLDALGSGRCGPAHTWSPLLATQHWRSSRAMSRTGPAQRPPANRPKAEARGLSGAFR